MNCCYEQELRPQPRHDAPHDTLVACELCMEHPGAATVCLVGSIFDGSGRLFMTQTPAGLWIVRLLLAPGTHNIHVHVTEFSDVMPWQEPVSCCWRAVFNVPVLTDNGDVTTELRIRIHDRHRPTQDDEPRATEHESRSTRH